MSHWGHSSHTRLRRVLAAASLVITAVIGLGTIPAITAGTALAPVAHAADCPPVQVVFARGREEPAGTGVVGTAFVNALRAKSDKTIGYYPVDYDADLGVGEGANDMSAHIQYMARNCPDTRLVLGGYSLGAAVTDMVLAMPGPLLGFDNPLPAGSDETIAAVALFGNGARKVLGGALSNYTGYANKIVDACNPHDPVCNPGLDLGSWADDWSAHLQKAYIDSGLVAGAAAFVAKMI
jgi:cutinase